MLPSHSIQFQTYFKSILIWLVFTCVIGYFQMKYTFQLTHLKPFYFIAPGVIGLIFGVMTARIILLNNKLKWISKRDPLTGAYNHGHYKQMLNEWCDEKATFSLILIDIDHFKKINDEYGHQAGDKALIRVSELVTETKRIYDIFARHGGEEFVLLTPRTKLLEASDIATRLCQIISEAPMPSDMKLTCSFGVSQFRADSDTSSSVFDRADRALYGSKHNGRNQVSLEEP
ncbi:MAG: hypothetical protein DIZ80_15165 [endosymbiont of Galathealinum brachiosum]|uniref:diguanylate cyclase n=1 Tax=endosymbiont of Galathealinum brachiosum TaxID=2200906 RepID=A0A370D941_9GAMM|nr:MAG: hypothetical protein DIZ80_15165 [endosymbiont of Galathealinum brachiosum]